MRINDPLELNVGDTFYECEYGVNLQMTVETKPTFENEQWCWVATDERGHEVNYLITKGFEHYGPKIYWQPAYSKVK